MSGMVTAERRAQELAQTVADLEAAAEAAGEAADEQALTVERIRLEINHRFGSQWGSGTAYDGASRLDDNARLRSAEDLLTILRGSEGRARAQLKEAQARLAEIANVVDTHKLKIIRPLAAQEAHRAMRVIIEALPRLVAGLAIRDNIRPGSVSAQTGLAEVLRSVDEVALRDAVAAERTRLMGTLD